MRSNKPLAIYVTPKCSPLVDKLGALLNMDLCYRDRANIIHNIFNSGYYAYYNKLELTNDPNIFDELKYIKDIEKQRAQRNLWDMRQYEMCVKNSIALNKID